MHGWMGKIQKIDLSTGKQETLEIGDDLRRLYMGGRGLGVKLYTQMCDQKTDPLSPENALLFLTGPLTGTMLTAGRYQMVSRSPLTSTICDSSSGGTFGAAMKRTGLDGIVVTGRADQPKYLLVTDDGIQVRDATHIWGKDTQTTKKSLLDETSSKACVASIGPAGENQVLYAAVMNDKDRAAGRGGMGAVMGSKNLKAVVVNGTQNISVADPQGLKELNSILDRLVDKNPVTGKSLQVLGTSVLVNVINAHGMYPTENFRRGVFNDAEGTSGEKIAETILKARSACYRCPIACGRATKTPGKEGEGPEYETVWAFGAQLSVNDLMAITEANYRCNELGLDTISCGNTIGCAMELSELGALPEKIAWGDAERMKQLVEDIAYRRGLGDELAQGSKRLSEKFGRPELSMQVKGMELPAYDPRGVQGQALSYATSNRGGCHMRAYIIGPEILGQPCFMDRFSTQGKAEIVVLFQDISAFVDSTVLCRFLQFALGVDTFAQMLRLVTGLDFTDEEVVTIGKRIYTLERLYNAKAGFTRKDDTLPPRFLKEELEEGASRSRLVKLDEMLESYYQLRGWDQNGAPREETVQNLRI
jgi:aldehyde:ferredoxin oxidoreductase